MLNDDIEITPAPEDYPERVCQNCGSMNNFDTDEGYTFCKNCGIFW